MDYYAPAPGAPSSFPRLETSVSDPSGRAAHSSVARHEEWHRQHVGPSAPGAAMETGLEDEMWRITLQPPEGMEALAGPYPERPGEPDCAYYMRTGLCGFGMTCRFNHPSNRRMASATAQSRGEYPERIGQPECQYYLKTGTCKFGATCKYHHPREMAGWSGRPQLNYFNLPSRSVEKDCPHYMRTGTCKYGEACKFNHPNSTVGPFASMPGPQLFPGSGPGVAPALQPYPAGLPTWPLARPPYLPSPRFPGPSPLLLPPPQNFMPLPGWNTYQGPIVPFPPPDGGQQGLQTSYMYSGAPQRDPITGGLHAPFPPYMPGSAAMGLPNPPSPSTSGPRENFLPERPGQPECQFYLRTGDCRFGMTCKYHHPRDRNTAYVLGPLGLPLRPGAPPCTFYTRNGFCKYGPTCKFDHSFLVTPFNPSGPPPPSTPGASYSMRSTSATAGSSGQEMELMKQQSTAAPSNDPGSSSGIRMARQKQSSSRESSEGGGRGGMTVQDSSPSASVGTSSQPDIHGAA